MARGWGDGTCTRQLHEVAFDMYETLCVELGVTSYRKLPVVGITPGDTDRSKMKHPEALGGMIPNWLDGRYGDASPMGYGDDTAQVTPSEFVSKMMERANYDNGREKSTGIKLIIGKCVGIESDVDEDGKTRVVTGVKYRRNDGDGEGDGEGGGGEGAAAASSGRRDRGIRAVGVSGGGLVRDGGRRRRRCDIVAHGGGEEHEHRVEATRRRRVWNGHAARSRCDGIILRGGR